MQFFGDTNIDFLSKRKIGYLVSAVVVLAGLVSLAIHGGPKWNIDFQETVSAIIADQLSDGSWHNGPLATIKHLFGLHLTVRSTTAKIDAALTWLLDKINFQNEKIHVNGEDFAAEGDLQGLPFIPSRPDRLLTGAILFMASLFGSENDPTVLSIYQTKMARGVVLSRNGIPF